MEPLDHLIQEIAMNISCCAKVISWNLLVHSLSKYPQQSRDIDPMLF